MGGKGDSAGCEGCLFTTSVQDNEQHGGTDKRAPYLPLCEPFSAHQGTPLSKNPTIPP